MSYRSDNMDEPPRELIIPTPVKSFTADLGSGPICRPPRGMPQAKERKRRRAPGEAAGTRKENDAYDTDDGVALACVEWVDRNVMAPRTFLIDDRLRVILDPTAGTGPFVRAARSVYPNAKIGATDIRPECSDSCIEAGANGFLLADSTELAPETIGLVDLIITNPPFTLADDLARHFYANTHPGAVLAFLLNVTFIGSQERWAENGLFKVAPLTYMVPIQPRPQFLDVNSKGKKASSPIECALFVWVKGSETTEINGVEHPSPGAIIPHEPIRWTKEGK